MRSLLAFLAIGAAAACNQHLETVPCSGIEPDGPAHEACFTWPQGSDGGAEVDGGMVACPAKTETNALFDPTDPGYFEALTDGVRNGDMCCYTVVHYPFIGC